MHACLLGLAWYNVQHFFRLVMIGDGATDMETCPPAVSDKFSNWIVISVLLVIKF